MRIAHFSDVHVTEDPRRIPWRALLGKRLTGWVNLKLFGRFERFAEVPAIARAFKEDVERQEPDFLVFSGDVTALSLPSEFARAAELFAPLLARTDIVGIPGNHDVYVRSERSCRSFHAHFGCWERSDLPDLAGPDGYPIIRLLGQRAAIVAAQSAVPRPLWDSSGELGPAALQALERALRDPRIASRTKLVCIHYAPRRASGRPDTRLHGLRDAEEFLSSAARGGAALVLHGHLHRRFVHGRGPVTPVPLACVGSLTDARRERAYHVYEIADAEVRVHVRRYRDGAFHADDGASAHILPI